MLYPIYYYNSRCRTVFGAGTEISASVWWGVRRDSTRAERGGGVGQDNALILLFSGTAERAVWYLR